MESYEHREPRNKGELVGQKEPLNRIGTLPFLARQG